MASCDNGIKCGDIENLYIAELSKSRPLVSRICWLILFLLMITSCGYIVVLLVAEYVEYASYNLVYTSLASSYTLPAITICNLNLLNKTKMENSTPNTDGDTLYDIYKSLTSAFSDRNSDVDVSMYEDLDTEEVYTNNAMNIEKAIISKSATFAKSPVFYKDFTDFHFTESGKCMEMNDNGYLVQKVNGPIGGFSIVLDAQTADYLPSTQDKGFRITLRQANETVLNKEFGFLVAPGFQYHINLHTEEITRLEEPWGSCKNTTDIFSNDIELTLKECFLNQILWMYMKLNDEGCGCFPWYFWERYMEDSESSTSSKYDVKVKERLIEYWTETLTNSFRVSFNDSCVYEDGSGYSGDTLDHLTNVSRTECKESCMLMGECRYYEFSVKTNDVMDARDCYLYPDTAELQLYSNDTSDVDGLLRGDTQCADPEICSIAAGARCENKIMDVLMENDTSPPLCYEPCSYDNYKYELSSSAFPTPEYWEETLSDQVTQYSDFKTAKNNLVKLVFYTEQMSSTQIVQTPSYEIQNFIAEMGGVTDLFIGLSFFTVYQLLEWLITRSVKQCVRTGRTDRGDADSENGGLPTYKPESRHQINSQM